MDRQIEALVKTLVEAELSRHHAVERTLQMINVSSAPTESPPSLSAFVDSGNTAWLLTSCALVLFMTLPGLALFYSGMVKFKNTLSCLMQVLSIACLIIFLWLCFGYSLSFAPSNPLSTGGNMIYGSGERLWLRGLKFDSQHYLMPSVPESVFCVFQLTFAIITAALMSGSFAERMSYGPMLVFVTLWHLIVYCPIAHATWHPKGFLFEAGVLDFAGGGVVHICSGLSGLATALVLGPRRGTKDNTHSEANIASTYTGLCMLLVGWIGFNAGSAGAANNRAGMAMLNTLISTSVAAFSWLITHWSFSEKGEWNVLAMVAGCVAGLVAVTPACGFIDPTGAFIIGLFAGPVCFLGAKLRSFVDDALDAFGVHAVGGMYGGIMTGFFATRSVGGIDGVFYNPHRILGGNQLGLQIYGIVVIAGWAFFASYCIATVVDQCFKIASGGRIALRVDADSEDKGLDNSYHGVNQTYTAEATIEKDGRDSIPSLTDDEPVVPEKSSAV